MLSPTHHPGVRFRHCSALSTGAWTSVTTGGSFMTESGFRRCQFALGFAAVALVVSACGGTAAGSNPTTAGASGDPATDKLAQVLARGTLVLSTDPAYAPNSYQVKGATRANTTKCQPTQLTGNQVSGYDAETGKAVAKVLGVEPCFVLPTWAQVVSGNWGDRWDVSWQSGAINSDRMTRLWMTQPYASEPSQFFVKADSPYTKPSDLDGKSVGACTGCTHELYLRGTLVLPGIPFTNLVKDPKVVTYDVERGGLKAVSENKLDAFLCATAVGEANIKSGLKLRALNPLAFTSMLSGFVDKKSGYAAGPFVTRINQILAGLHADGTLSALSVKFYGVDYAKEAGQFDLSTIGQNVT